MDNKFMKMIGYGVLTWLIPWAFAYFFAGQFKRGIFGNGFFESLMAVLAVLVVCGCLIFYFQKEKTTLSATIQVGFIWFVVNIVLDILVILINGGKLSLESYMVRTGLRYLTIPVIAMTLSFRK